MRMFGDRALMTDLHLPPIKARSPETPQTLSRKNRRFLPIRSKLPKTQNRPVFRIASHCERTVLGGADSLGANGDTAASFQTALSLHMDLPLAGQPFTTACSA